MFTWCRWAAKVNVDYWAGRICSASLKPAFMSVEVAVARLRCTCSLGAGEQRESTSTGQVGYAVQSLKPAVMSVEVAVAIILSGTTKEAS